MRVHDSLEQRLASFLLESAVKIAEIVSADVFIIVESPSARMWTAAGDGGDGLRSAFLQDGLRPRANDVEYGTAKHYDQSAASSFCDATPFGDLHVKDETLNYQHELDVAEPEVTADADDDAALQSDSRAPSPLLCSTTFAISNHAPFRKRHSSLKHKTRLKPKFKRLQLDPLNLSVNGTTSPTALNDEFLNDAFACPLTTSPSSPAASPPAPPEAFPPTPPRLSPLLESGSSKQTSAESDSPNGAAAEESDPAKAVASVLDLTPPLCENGLSHAPAVGQVASAHVLHAPTSVPSISNCYPPALSGPKEDYYENITHSILAMMSHYSPETSPRTRLIEGAARLKDGAAADLKLFRGSPRTDLFANCDSEVLKVETDSNHSSPANAESTKEEEARTSPRASGSGFGDADNARFSNTELELRGRGLKSCNRRPFTCSLCKKTFTRKDTCREHLKRIHFKEVLHCHVCNMTFNSRQTMWFHRKKTGH